MWRRLGCFYKNELVKKASENCIVYYHYSNTNKARAKSHYDGRKQAMLAKILLESVIIQKIYYEIIVNEKSPNGLSLVLQEVGHWNDTWNLNQSQQHWDLDTSCKSINHTSAPPEEFSALKKQVLGEISTLGHKNRRNIK